MILRPGTCVHFGLLGIYATPIHSLSLSLSSRSPSPFSATLQNFSGALVTPQLPGRRLLLRRKQRSFELQSPIRNFAILLIHGRFQVSLSLCVSLEYVNVYIRIYARMVYIRVHICACAIELIDTNSDLNYTIKS